MFNASVAKSDEFKRFPVEPNVMEKTLVHRFML